MKTRPKATKEEMTAPALPIEPRNAVIKLLLATDKAAQQARTEMIRASPSCEDKRVAAALNEAQNALWHFIYNHVWKHFPKNDEPKWIIT